ncbi:MAG: NAD(+) synthetase [Candidatus Aminicenantes bacterium RBG_16_63_14]|nr:MAG: NAD(+) synthetase [Candidatus Aminicenantes bacterium RBG_16_63_14]OGD25943.1 MAG: NAD(+) synthetase [Candidatus Aminicenantes bacterium RBG_19FT_COMBO_65_30]
MLPKINAALVEKVLVRFIRDEFGKCGCKKGILGLSGGLDSAVTAALAARALGPGNVLGLIMPYGKGFPEDVRDAGNLARRLGIRHKTIDIAAQVDIYFAAHPTRSRVQRGNKMARERMSILYDYSAREDAFILGTSNKTELLIGYGTIHGDMACAINPMGDLYKTQVRELAAHLRLPAAIRRKVPTAGLWPGQTDEGELGLTYEELDDILYGLVEGRRSRREMVEAGHRPAIVARILRMIKNSEFKRKLPPIAKLSPRSVGHDFLYPYDWGK